MFWVYLFDPLHALNLTICISKTGYSFCISPFRVYSFNPTNHATVRAVTAVADSSWLGIKCIKSQAHGVSITVQHGIVLVPSS